MKQKSLKFNTIFLSDAHIATRRNHWMIIKFVDFFVCLPFLIITIISMHTHFGTSLSLMVWINFFLFCFLDNSVSLLLENNPCKYPYKKKWYVWNIFQHMLFKNIFILAISDIFVIYLRSTSSRIYFWIPCFKIYYKYIF